MSAFYPIYGILMNGKIVNKRQKTKTKTKSKPYRTSPWKIIECFQIYVPLFLLLDLYLCVLYLCEKYPVGSSFVLTFFKYHLNEGHMLFRLLNLWNTNYPNCRLSFIKALQMKAFEWIKQSTEHGCRFDGLGGAGAGAWEWHSKSRAASLTTKSHWGASDH